MAKIYYARVDEFWRKEQKYEFLEKAGSVDGIEWTELVPDARGTWLTEGMQADFDTFMPMGTKETSSDAVFSLFSNGVKTNRDTWAYNFDANDLGANVQRMIETYNDQVRLYHEKHRGENVDDVVSYDDKQIAWSRDLKLDLKRGKQAQFSNEKIRHALYRPFTKSFLFFDRILNEEVYQQPRIFPTSDTERENRIILSPNLGSRTNYWCFCADILTDVALTSLDTPQTYPFYTYSEDGTDRRENITDWALAEFRSHYNDESITKWEIFHYIYALLHHPEYRARYAANLKRDLPRIPFAPEWKPYTQAGERLAELHVNYEQQPEYPLKMIEDRDQQLDWRVEKMRLSKDKTQIAYNNFLTLAGIPPEAFEYRLGNRSALEWAIDQYRVKTDERSGITNDPNRVDDPEYIVRLLKQVITVSLETMKIVKALPSP